MNTVITTAVATFSYPGGAPLTFTCGPVDDTDDQFDGTETVTCGLKVAVNGNQVPRDSHPIVVSTTPVFVAAAGSVLAHYLFALTESQVVAIGSNFYITDVKITLAQGQVIRTDPVVIAIGMSVS